MGKDEVEKILRELLGKMQITVDALTTAKVAGQNVLTIETKDSGVLIGTGGETLQALNHILRKITEGSTAEKDTNDDPSRFIIDVNGYHLKHLKTLESQAHMLAERARTFRYDVEMSPMNPYDRLIVHASLQGAPGISTQSNGEGPLRHVVIKYVGGEAAAPEGSSAL